MADLWYFAHPYTGNEEHNFELCCQRASELIGRGYKIYAPICHSHPIHKAKRHIRVIWMALDYAMFMGCRWAGMIVAPGGVTSRGCQAERIWFEHAGLPILTYDVALKQEPT